MWMGRTEPIAAKDTFNNNRYDGVGGRGLMV
jgi:hypothetical protein